LEQQHGSSLEMGREESHDRMPAKKKQLLVINGPNLNLLGTRERQHYGTDTLAAITDRLVTRAAQAGVALGALQSNSEAALVERIQQAREDGIDFIIINPAAYTHTSVAMRDALAAVGIPFIEVHLSNVFARESFRRESYFTDIAVGIISGLQGCLDRERGGEIAANLDRLYDYMTVRLLAVHTERGPAPLDEVGGLLGTIKTGWDGIRDAAH